MAEDIYKKVENSSEVYVWLTSQIGRPIDQPSLAAVELVPQQGKTLLKGYQEIVHSIIRHHFENIPELCQSLIHGEIWLPS